MELINSYYSRLSFGFGAYAIEISISGLDIIIKTGTPQRLCNYARIEKPSKDLVKEIQELTSEFLSEKGFEHNYSDLFTHIWIGGEWVKR